MSDKFDARAALGRFNKILERYDNESLELYSEECYIEDLLYFIGKSIDEDKYGFDARGYRRFLCQKIAPFSNKIAKMEFTSKLKRG